MESGSIEEHEAFRPASGLMASINTHKRLWRDSPASDETSEAKEGTFSRGACFLLFGVSHWLCRGKDELESDDREKEKR